MVVAENPAADAPNHRGMPVNESRESFFIRAVDKVVQQLPVSQTRSLKKDNLPKVLNDPIYSTGRHLDFLANSTAT
jgi:hypothetical protein